MRFITEEVNLNRSEMNGNLSDMCLALMTEQKLEINIPRDLVLKIWALAPILTRYNINKRRDHHHRVILKKILIDVFR